MDLDRLAENDWIDKKKIELVEDISFIKEMYNAYLALYNYYILTNDVDNKLLDSFNYYNNVFGMECVTYETNGINCLSLSTKILYSLFRYDATYYKVYGYSTIVYEQGKIRDIVYEFPFILVISLCKYYKERKTLKRDIIFGEGELFFNLIYKSIVFNKQYDRYIPKEILREFTHMYKCLFNITKYF